MPINAGYEYFNAEKVYEQATTVEAKIVALEGMIKAAPKHKGSENLLAELKTRLKKLREKQEKVRKSGGGRKGIKKEGYQVVLVGLPNSGKSSLLAALTNAKPLSSPHPFSTREPEIGTMDFEGVKVQVVDLPSIGSSFFDIGIVNTANCIIQVVQTIDDVAELNKSLERAIGDRLIVIPRIDLLDNEGRRKLEARCRAKRLSFVLVSSVSGEGIIDLKRAIFRLMRVIRVYTKEPGKPSSPLPIVLPEGSIVRDVAESILKGFSSRVIETRLTGPSAKFANQKVGLSHILKDKDIVEFYAR